MNPIKCVSLCLVGFLAQQAFSGECTLFDWKNYPFLPTGHRGAEVGDYAKSRELDIRFSGHNSLAEIRVQRGDTPIAMSRDWSSDDVVFNVDFRSTKQPLPERISVEIKALDRTVKPIEKKMFRTAWVNSSDAIARGDAFRLRLRLEKPEFAPEYEPDTIRVYGSSDGRMIITSISVEGASVRPTLTPDPAGAASSADRSHLWLKVKGRNIVTSPTCEGGERPFIPAGVGYGKDVCLHGYDEIVASYCKSMGLNTIRLAFYTQYFNSRYHEPLEFRDVARFIDPVVAAARRHGLYVILDDHAYFKDEIDEANARGEQHGSGWTLARYEEWVKRWGLVAQRYRDEPQILGYELCNEPVCEPAVARKWYRRAIEEIRKYDQRHIVIVGTHHWSHSRAMMPTWEGLADWIDAPYNNVVFSFHDYPQDEDPWIVGKHLAAFQARYNVPVLCTEFGAGDAPEIVHREYQAGMLGLFASRGIGWMLWTLEDRPAIARGFPTRFAKTDTGVEIVEAPKPRYWIPQPDVWAPIAKTVASEMPQPAKGKAK